MDLEQPNLANEVEEEIDVYLRVPNKDFYLVQYPSRSTQTAFTKYETIESVRIQPEQRNLAMTIKIDQKCENFANNQGNIKYELNSKTINNRTNYCIGKISNGSLILVPITTCVQMKKTFKEYEEKFKAPEAKIEAGNEGHSEDISISEINAQIRKKDNLKLLERKVRTHPFQKKVFDSEAEIPLKLFQQNTQESSRLVDSLLDPPKEFKTLKPLGRGEYLKYLF